MRILVPSQSDWCRAGKSRWPAFTIWTSSLSFPLFCSCQPSLSVEQCVVIGTCFTSIICGAVRGHWDFLHLHFLCVLLVSPGVWWCSLFCHVSLFWHVVHRELFLQLRVFLHLTPTPSSIWCPPPRELTSYSSPTGFPSSAVSHP